MDTFIRIIADGLVPVVALIGAFALLFLLPSKTNRWQAYARIIMAGITALLAAKIVATFYQPDAARPFVVMGVQAKAAYLDNAGFPSDHVLFTMAIALAVLAETGRKKLSLVLFFLVALIALGRVLALVHTPLDVLGGAAFALFGALWYFTKGTKSPARKA